MSVYNNTAQGIQSGSVDRPEQSRGLSSLDNVGNVGDLASSLGQPGQTDRFSPLEPSPLATRSPITSQSPAAAGLSGSSNLTSGSGYTGQDTSFGTSASSTNPLLSSSNTSSNTLGSSNPLLSSNSLNSSGLGSSGLNLPGNSSSALSSNSDLGSSSSISGLGSSNTSGLGSSSSGNTIDIGGAQTSGTGLSTPGGVIKGEPGVENLVTAIGGIVLNAPLAAYEAVAGKVGHHATQAREVANQQGFGQVAASAQGVVSSIAGVAGDKVNQLNASRGPDAQPITETLTAYATSAAQTAQALAAQAAHSVQGLAGRAHANAPSAGEVQGTVQDTASRAQHQASSATSGIGATLSNYAHQAQDAVSSAAHTAAVQAQTLGAKVGLTSAPHDSNVTPTPSATLADGTVHHPTSGGVSHSTGSTGFSSSNLSQSTTPSTNLSSTTSTDTVSGRYDLSQGELPSESVTKTSTAQLTDNNPYSTSQSNNPFTGSHTVGAAELPSINKSSDSGATGSVPSSLQYPDSIAQPGSASYGQGRVGDL